MVFEVLVAQDENGQPEMVSARVNTGAGMSLESVVLALSVMSSGSAKIVKSVVESVPGMTDQKMKELDDVCKAGIDLSDRCIQDNMRIGLQNVEKTTNSIGPGANQASGEPADASQRNGSGPAGNAPNQRGREAPVRRPHRRKGGGSTPA
jgi:hypothetical protein